MKRKRMMLLILCTLLTLTIACSNNDEESDKSNNLILKYASDYSIKHENEDGTIEIGVIAPDFETIINNAIKNNQEDEMNIENVYDLINEYPDYKKEYVIIVNDLSDKEAIEAIINDKIAEELIKSAITNIVYEEEWSAEEWKEF